MSALGKCMALVSIANSLQAEGKPCDGKAVAELFNSCSCHMEAWSGDTTARYLSVGRKLNGMTEVAALLERWETFMGRMAAFDNITALRAFTSLNLTDDDFLYVASARADMQASSNASPAAVMRWLLRILAASKTKAKTVFLEQLAGIRAKGALTTLRKAAVRYDIPKRLRAILARRDLLTHIMKIFPRMDAYTKPFACWQWYLNTYGVQEDGTSKEGKPVQVQDCTVLDGEEEAERDSTVPDATLPAGACSTYTCYSKLVGFCTQLMQNHHEMLLCKLLPSYVPGKTLNLATPDAEKIREILSEIQAKYDVDFLTQPEPIAKKHKTTHTMEGKLLEVTTAQSIDSLEEYKAELAKYNEAASQHEAQALQEFLDHRLVLLVDALEPEKTRISDKLSRLALMKEKKRKLFVYDATLDGPLNWTAIKKRGLSVWAGSGPGLCQDRLEARRGGLALQLRSSAGILLLQVIMTLRAVSGGPEGGLWQHVLPGHS